MTYDCSLIINNFFEINEISNKQHILYYTFIYNINFKFIILIHYFQTRLKFNLLVLYYNIFI